MFMLEKLKHKKWSPVRDVSSFVGQIISMSIVICPVAQIMTKSLCIDVLKARTCNSYIKLSEEILQQLMFWKTALSKLNVKYLDVTNGCSRIVCSDASDHGYAGYEVNTINGIAHGSWLLDEACKSSTWREQCAVCLILMSLLHVFRYQRIKWFTDNTSVCSIVNKGSMKPDLQDLALRIFQFTSINSIHLEIEWIPRSENSRADYLSKIVEVDDLGIASDVLNMIGSKWAKIDIDYFASEHNAKLPIFCICGNEAADVAAKESLSQDIIASQVPYTDLKPHINSFIANKWQERWSSCPDNKLFKIKPTLGVWPSGFRNSRKEEVVLSRLRIGHTYFSHSYILRQEDPPECTACQEIYSVRHVLIDCIDLGHIRPRFYTVPDMKTLFDTVSVDRILSFVKEVDLFTKI